MVEALSEQLVLKLLVIWLPGLRQRATTWDRVPQSVTFHTASMETKLACMAAAHFLIEAARPHPLWNFVSGLAFNIWSTLLFCSFSALIDLFPIRTTMRRFILKVNRLKLHTTSMRLFPRAHPYISQLPTQLLYLINQHLNHLPTHPCVLLHFIIIFQAPIWKVLHFEGVEELGRDRVEVNQSHVELKAVVALGLLVHFV